MSPRSPRRRRRLAVALLLGVLAIAGAATAQPAPEPPPAAAPSTPAPQAAPTPDPFAPAVPPSTGLPLPAPPPGSVMRRPEHLSSRPSGFWTSNRPAVGGAYRYRLLGVGVLVLGLTVLLLVRMLRRVDRTRAPSSR